MTDEKELEQLAGPRGAATSAIVEAERRLGPLPADYREFLAGSDAFEGFLGPGTYLALWPVNEIADLNESYGVNTFAPGLTLIGTDGGGTGYGYTTKGPSVRYLRVPLVGMSVAACEDIGGTLAEAIRTLRTVSDA